MKQIYILFFFAIACHAEETTTTEFIDSSTLVSTISEHEMADKVLEQPMQTYLPLKRPSRLHVTKFGALGKRLDQWGSSSMA